MEAETRMHQGRCSFPIIDGDRFLDRLAGLEQVIRPDDIQQALEATGRAVDSFSLEAIDSFSFTWLFNNLRQTHGCGIEQFAIGTSFGHP